MSMPYKILDTFEQYEELLAIRDMEERKDYFRYTMMDPLKKMWNLINVPIKAKQTNGYDVLMATKMLGYADISNTEILQQGLSILKDNNALMIARNSINKCIENTCNAGLNVSTDLITFGMYIADPVKLNLQKGYTGFGGIPGFITVNIFPNEYNLPKIPAVIAHEFHHNIRFSYFEWDHGNVTVGDYLVAEGLAESFAMEQFGANQLGPWVTSMDKEDLEYSIHVIGEALNVKGFAEVSSYMFGDEIAKNEGYQPVGLSFCAGYAVGFEVVQTFMKMQNKTIYETTLLTSDEIIEGSGLFKD